MKLYFAYGANTNVASMAGRCPDAKALALVTIPDHKLVFRGVADVVEHDNAKVRGVMWAITERCERSLDAFEGYPRLYVKKYITVRWQGRDQALMLYVMNGRDSQSPPPPYYEQCLREGYTEFGISHRQIDAAIRDAKRAEEQDRKLRRPVVVAGGSQWRSRMVAGSRWRDDEVVQARDDFAPQQEPDDGFWPDNLPWWRR